MTATGWPRHEGSKPSAYGSTVTVHLYRYFWIYPSPLPSSFALPIGLIRLDGVGKCDGTDSATGGLTIRGLRITVKIKRGMTVPESTSTSTAGNYRTGSTERNQGEVHLPVKKAITKKFT